MREESSGEERKKKKKGKKGKKKMWKKEKRENNNNNKKTFLFERCTNECAFLRNDRAFLRRRFARSDIANQLSEFDRHLVFLRFGHVESLPPPKELQSQSGKVEPLIRQRQPSSSHTKRSNCQTGGCTAKTRGFSSKIREQTTDQLWNRKCKRIAKLHSSFSGFLQEEPQLRFQSNKSKHKLFVQLENVRQLNRGHNLYCAFETPCWARRTHHNNILLDPL